MRINKHRVQVAQGEALTVYADRDDSAGVEIVVRCGEGVVSVTWDGAPLLTFDADGVRVGKP